MLSNKNIKKVLIMLESSVDKSEKKKKLKEVSGQVQGREEYRGIQYKVYYAPPNGYFAGGDNETGKIISYQPFDKYEDAKEHAELEIDGYLDNADLNEASTSKSSEIFTGAAWSRGQDMIVLRVNSDGSVYGQGQKFDFERATPQEALSQLKKWGYEYIGVE
jgi:hypothetical protein